MFNKSLKVLVNEVEHGDISEVQKGFLIILTIGLAILGGVCWMIEKVATIGKRMVKEEGNL